MTDTPPPDLVDLKRRFQQVEAEQAAYAATLPSSLAIVSGEAALTGEQREHWAGLQAQLQDTAMAIHRHPAFDGLSQLERYKLDKAASAAAKT